MGVTMIKDTCFFYQWVIKCIAMKEWSIAMSFKAGVWQLIEGGSFGDAPGS